MKKRTLIITGILFLLFIGYNLFQYLSIPDGNSVKSREQLLKDIPKGVTWNIAIEQELQDLIVSGIYSSGGKTGIAVFEPEGNRYKLYSREWRNSADRIIITGISIDGIWYDLVWFNGAETEKAELTYTQTGNNIEETFTFDTSDMEIICNPAPADNYALDVIYYDKDGNTYE